MILTKSNLISNRNIINMEEYTIPCTPEQTKKALKLGAPIKTISYDPPVPPPTGWAIYKNNCCKPPTAEQMIGWLEEQEDVYEIYVSKSRAFHCWTCIVTSNKDKIIFINNIYQTRKEAALAAIDAALEYLTNNKKS